VGRLEHSLDDLVTFAFVTAVTRGGSYEMQTALGRRLELLRSIYYNCDVLRPLHERVVALTAIVKDNARNRNLVLHSSWLGFQDGTPPTLKMHNIQHHQGGVKTSDFGPSICNLWQMSHNFHRRTSEIKALFLATAGTIDPEFWTKAQTMVNVEKLASALLQKN
jgi:hypothetical protein